MMQHIQRNWTGRTMRKLAVGTIMGVMVFGLATTALAGPPDPIPLFMDNGVDGDGHLQIQTAEYGSFGNLGPLFWLDLFDPTGDGQFSEKSPTFSTNLFLFTGPSGCGQGLQRVVISGNEGILGIPAYQGSNLLIEITSSNNQITDASLESQFRVFGGGVDLLFDLFQEVDNNDGVKGPNDEVAARLSQTYTITNQGAPLNFTLLKHIDEDMLWDSDAGNYLDDSVGADFAELEGRPQVFAQDADLIQAAMVFRTREDMTLVDGTVEFIYYIGKQDTTPPGNPDYPCGDDCPAYDYGTDCEYWDQSWGAPNCWKNFVPEVGYDIPGISPFGLEGDSHMGLQVMISLGIGATYEITYETIYGFRPLPTICQPPLIRTTLLDFDEGNDCATFAWEFKNNNPFVPGQPENEIEVFYIDVEAGDGAQNCTELTGPDGWTVENCTGFDSNNHALFKLSGGTPIQGGDKVFGRLTIDANGDSPTTNPLTGVVVDPLAVLLRAAQGGGPPGVVCKAGTDCEADEECVEGQCLDACQQEEEVCANGNYNFGPTDKSSDWSFPLQAKAFRPVPSLSAWAKFMLLAVLIGGGMMLVLRSRRPIVA